MHLHSITLTAHLMSLEEVWGFKNDMNFLQTPEVFFLEEEGKKNPTHKHLSKEWMKSYVYKSQYNEEMMLILG